MQINCGNDASMEIDTDKVFTLGQNSSKENFGAGTGVPMQ